MNILHLLSQNHLTGAEVYAAQLIHEQASKNTVYQISNGFFMPTEAKQIKLKVETKSRFQFIRNIFWLRRFLIENKIHVIHTHSRAAVKLAYWARFGVKTGLVATIHGRQHPSLSKKIWNQYGDRVVTVCETIQKQLIRDFNYNPLRISVVRNAISEKGFYFSHTTQTFPKDRPLKIAIVGRTTGPKGERTRQFVNAIPGLEKELQFKADLVLVGASNSSITLNLNSDVRVRQIHVEHTLTSKDYNEYDLVIGSGRVAMESLLTGVPTICFGEASYQGLVRSKNVVQSIESNFGDIELDSMNPVLNRAQLKSDLEALFANELRLDERQVLAGVIQNEFNSQKIAHRIHRAYESSYFLRNCPKWIPTLMYHKIPDQEIQSQHKIYVTKDNFKKHLQFFKDQGFQTLTFNQLKKFKSGETDFSQFPKKPLILTFDDGYVDNLENASPLLKEFGFRAQIFLLADPTIDSNHWDHSETEKPHDIISGSDRQKWKDSAFEIGSHGFSHQKITQMTEDQARVELRESKKKLQDEFNTEVSVYAFTYGDTSILHAHFAF
ncbi:MAG: polysaccharide deacetylase family protein, partial [Bdellovibrio sp.]|nr:polysaccharide deacetylase family protein [Bdellovibrio sp.]